jgi:hypothetical protein
MQSFYARPLAVPIGAQLTSIEYEEYDPSDSKKTNSRFPTSISMPKQNLVSGNHLQMVKSADTTKGCSEFSL